MKRLIIVIALLLVSLPVLLLAVLILAKAELDLTPYRDSINRWASHATERKVTIDGDLHIALGMQPSLALSQLRVADGQNDSLVLAKIDRLFAQVNLGVLTGEDLDLLEFELAGGELDLRIDSTGQPNWVFGESDDDSEEFELGESFIPRHARIDISNVKLRFEDQQQGTKWLLDLAKAQAELKDADAPLELIVEGVWDELPLKISGNISPSTNARGLKAPQLVSLTALWLGVETKVAGKITDLGRSTQLLDLTFDSRTTELRHLRDVFGNAVPEVKQATLHCQIKDDSNIMLIDDIDTRLDKTKITGNLSAIRAGERPKIEGKLQLTDLDTRLWLQPNTAVKETPATEEVLLLDQLAHLPLPATIDIKLVKLTLAGRRVVLPNGLKRSFSLDLNSDAHNLEIKFSEIDFAKAPLVGSLHKQRLDQGAPTYQLKISDPDVDLAEWVEILDLAGQVEGEMLLDIDLRSSGISDEQLRKALEGHVRLLMGAGKANVAALDNLMGGLRAALGNVFTEKSELAVVNCSAVDIAFAGGQAKVDLGLIDTTYSTVLVDGSADFVNQTLDLQVIPKKKKALSLSVAPKILIQGSTRAPEYIIEKGSLVLSLGELLTNVAYPPSLLVGVFDEAALENPCVAMLSGKAAPGTTEPVASQPAGTTPEKPAAKQKPLQRIHGADLLDH